MNILILNIFLLGFSMVACGQNVIEVATADKSSLIADKPLDFRLRLNRSNKYLILDYMERLNHDQLVLSDTSVIRELLESANKQDSSLWLESELPINKIVIQEGTYIRQKQVRNKLGALDEFEVKKLKKEIRKYNSNYQSTSWRSYPLSVSKPIYLKNDEYAFIAIVFGNGGGVFSLYQKSKSKWALLGHLDRWAY